MFKYNTCRYFCNFSLPRKLAYPFSVPVGVSYSCRTGAISTTPIISNPNRFVQFGNESVPGPDDNVAELDEGGPVVQFIGLHVRINYYEFFILLL